MMNERIKTAVPTARCQRTPRHTIGASDEMKALQANECRETHRHRKCAARRAIAPRLLKTWRLQPRRGGWKTEDGRRMGREESESRQKRELESRSASHSPPTCPACSFNCVVGAVMGARGGASG